MSSEKGVISSWVSSSKTIITIFRSSPFCKNFVTGSSRWARRKLLRLNLVAVRPKKTRKSHLCKDWEILFAGAEKYFYLRCNVYGNLQMSDKWTGFANVANYLKSVLFFRQLKILSWPHYDGGILKNLEKAMSFGDCEMIEGIVGILWKMLKVGVNAKLDGWFVANRQLLQLASCCELTLVSWWLCKCTKWFTTQTSREFSSKEHNNNILNNNKNSSNDSWSEQTKSSGRMTLQNWRGRLIGSLS